MPGGAGFWNRKSKRGGPHQAVPGSIRQVVRGATYPPRIYPPTSTPKDATDAMKKTLPSTTANPVGDSGMAGGSQSMGVLQEAATGPGEEAKGAGIYRGGQDMSEPSEMSEMGEISESSRLEMKRLADKKAKFATILEAANADLEKLKKLAWGGIPDVYRGDAWQLMLAYLPLNRDRREVRLH